jgi:energy-converting hydrogenase B subunit D
MTFLVAASLLLVAFGGTAVVLTRDPKAQAVVLSMYGLLLAVMFVVLQAPDVAMAQLAVGTVVLPLLVVLTIARSGDRG